MEIILQFCDNLRISVGELFGMEISEGRSAYMKTFADLSAILIDLDRRGLPIKGKTSYIQQENPLVVHLDLEIFNAQLATFIPDWNKTNEELASGLMDEDEYAEWLDDTLHFFNVPIEEYLYKK